MAFVRGKGAVGATFQVRQMMEQYEVADGKLYMVFVNRKISLQSGLKKSNLVGF